MIQLESLHKKTSLSCLRKWIESDTTRESAQKDVTVLLQQGCFLQQCPRRAMSDAVEMDPKVIQVAVEMDPKVIQVKRLHKKTSKDDLRALAEQFGAITNISLWYGFGTGLIEMQDAQVVESLLSRHGSHRS